MRGSLRLHCSSLHRVAHTCRRRACSPVQSFPARHVCQPLQLVARSKGREDIMRRFSAAAAATEAKQEESKDTHAGHSVSIITTVGCKFCKKTKEALREADIEFEEVEISRIPGLLGQVKEIVGQTTVPQVFVGGEFVGGSDEALKLLDEGQLLQKGSGDSDTGLPDKLRHAVDSAAQDFEEEQKRASVPPGLTWEQLQDLKALAGDMLAARSELFGLHWAGLRPLQNTAKLEDLKRWPRIRDDPVGKLALLQQAQQLCMVSPPQDLQISGGEVAVAELPASEHLRVLLRLASMSPQPRLGQPLNGSRPWFGKGRNAEQVAERLRQQILGLYDRHLTEDGKAVRYGNLKQDQGFRDYVAGTAELQRVDLFELDEAQRKALFINLYNAIIIHGLTAFGPANNQLTRLIWWAQVKYDIGGLSFSTLDMEHGILRGNAPSPAAIPVLLGKPEWAKPFFNKEDDPRKKLSVPTDPRIHFALVCGAKSCPPIKMYTPDNLEDGLSSAAAAFCEGEVKVHGNSLELSPVFKWYAGDFGGKQGTLQFLLDHTKGELHDSISRLKSKPDDLVEFQWQEYDWSSNAA